MSDVLDVLRTEQKYRLTKEQLSRLSFLVSQVLTADMHSRQGAYSVRSLYFDTLDNRDYFEKLDGCDCRRKIRLRIYSPDAKWAKLEMKEKQGDLQRKRSLLLTRTQAEKLCHGRYAVLTELESEFAKELYGRMSQFLYRPVCLIEYDRKAYTAAVNDTRVTFDESLRMTQSELDIFKKQISWIPLERDGTGTMEVKFNRFLLSYVKQLVSLPSCSRTSASKYCAARNFFLGNDV